MRWSPSCAGARWALLLGRARGLYEAAPLVPAGRDEGRPEDPWAWEAGVVVDAAFARYLREAADYAGGAGKIRA